MMAEFFAVLFAGTSLGLVLLASLLWDQLKFEREWRRDEEEQHEKWFRIATGYDPKDTA